MRGRVAPGIAAAPGAGFTLLELMVALAVASLIFALAVPWGGGRRERAVFAGSAREIAQALRLTRGRAIAENRPAAFTLDLGRLIYQAAGAPAPRALPKGSRVTLYTAEDEVANGALGAIRFYPDGSSTGGGVVLAGAGRRWDVLVDWLTGAVAIHERAEAAAR